MPSAPTLRLALVAAVLLAIFGAYHAGRWKERADQRARAAEARVTHIQDSERTEDEIESMDDSALRDELDGRLSPGRN